jgi:hypothetical protein
MASPVDSEYQKLLLNYPILKHFAWAHLPEPLQKISKPFCSLAVELVTMVPANAETSTALRKLLEAKDCAVRAAIG